MHLPLTALEGEPRLTGWRDSVGAPVALRARPPGGAHAGTPALILVCWNMWIGRGNLEPVLARARTGARASAHGAPIVVLLQEAYRAGDAVPAPSGRGVGAVDFSRRAFPEHDIVTTARRLGLNLVYAPSMRNGTHRSDRGSAILSSLPLEHPAAWELPYCYQRRVAVAATVRIGERRLRVASAHLDPRGGSARDLLGVLGRGAQASELVRGLLDGAGEVPIVLGADVILSRGRREPAWQALARAGFTHGVPAREPAWRHTFHRAPRLLLDWVLVRDPVGALARVDVHRLDEHPADRGPYVFGSDHHPLVARIEAAPALVAAEAAG
jgi:endonuclease/exonuclease/phosphatase family metal-dependent hydrolase